MVSPIGEVTFDKEEPIENLTTWVYENGSFVPIGKLTQNESFSIVSDYIGRPVLAFDEKGEKVWSCDYDIYGRVRKLQGDKAFIPFRQLGQYEDEEIGLYYNRFRYYDPNSGLYISQDPIGLIGGLSFYAYVHDVNGWVDAFGLLGELQLIAKEISDSGKHFFSRVLRVVAVGEDSKGKLYAASSNGLDVGQIAKAQELGVEPLNTSTVFVNGKNLHAEEVLMKEIDDLKAVGTYKRMPCGIDEHNCLGQLEQKGIKVDNCH